MRFFKHSGTNGTFAPEIHRFLVEVDGQYLYPMKGTDKWCPLGERGLAHFREVPKDEVPPEVRRKAGQRLGAYRRHHREVTP